MRDPLKLRDFTEESESSAYAYLEGIRERRLQAYRVYEEALQQKQAITNEKTLATLKRHLELFNKELSTLDKKIESVEKRVRKMAALRLELAEHGVEIQWQ